ncbi:MAG: hypothetical protein GEV03_11475 [Streptosporangiales bacterium]|nr:hypothetical protein [Streptosporangiales bacterium]
MTAVREALSILGWSGFAVVPARVLGRRQLVACALDEDEHDTRVAEGRLPVADPLQFRCVAHGDPGFLTRRPPVRIAGAIAVRKGWRSARANLGGFTAFGPRVAVLPGAEARRRGVAAEAIVAGFGVIADDPDGLRLIHHPDTRPPASRTWAHRLVEEVLYDTVLTASRSSTP